MATVESPPVFLGHLGELEDHREGDDCRRRRAHRGGFVRINSQNFKANVGRASVALATWSDVSSIAQAETNGY